MDLELKGRRALVTGAGRNLGPAIAAGLVAEGCSLALCARSGDELEKTAAALRERGAQVFAAVADVSDPAALPHLEASPSGSLIDAPLPAGGLEPLGEGASPGCRLARREELQRAEVG